jgi:hypothetical protein
MIDIHDENYGPGEFDLSQDDLAQVAEGLERDGAPQESKEIALRIIRRRMEQDGNGNELDEGILLKYGERIVGHLEEALQSDLRFSSLEGKWFLADKLPAIEDETLQKIHHMLLQTPLSLDEILAVVKEERSTDQTLWRMAVQTVLHRSPERFENIGTPARPQWKGRLAEVEQAEATHYAYDPQTYEILCRPGQRLSQKKAQRLQELKLYGHVVTFAK